jgi:hypothetical protein
VSSVSVNSNDNNFANDIYKLSFIGGTINKLNTNDSVNSMEIVK